MSVSEAEAPEAYDTLGSARAQLSVTESRTAALAGSTVEADVVEISDVEYVERSVDCGEDVGYRTHAVVDLHSVDGSLSVRLPALVALTNADQQLWVTFVDEELELPADAQIPELGLAEGAVVAGLALEVDNGEVTLVRVDMAESCTELATCDATERTPVVTWTQVGPGYDLWYGEVGP